MQVVSDILFHNRHKVSTLGVTLRTITFYVTHFATFFHTQQIITNPEQPMYTIGGVSVHSLLCSDNK